MKALFISYDKAHHEEVLKTLDRNSQRGFTYWENTQGRGSVKGEPHYGSHAWPSINSSMMVMVDDDKIDRILEALKKIDNSRPALGLRAFVMNVEKSI